MKGPEWTDRFVETRTAAGVFFSHFLRETETDGGRDGEMQPLHLCQDGLWRQSVCETETELLDEP